MHLNKLHKVFITYLYCKQYIHFIYITRNFVYALICNSAEHILLFRSSYLEVFSNFSLFRYCCKRNGSSNNGYTLRSQHCGVAVFALRRRGRRGALPMAILAHREQTSTKQALRSDNLPQHS